MVTVMKVPRIYPRDPSYRLDLYRIKSFGKRWSEFKLKPYVVRLRYGILNLNVSRAEMVNLLIIPFSGGVDGRRMDL